MAFNFIKNVILNETAPTKKLEQLPLAYKKDQLEPAISEDTMKYHYGKLAKSYVERYNDGEGDPEFNEAGAFLHNILFAQYHSPTSNNDPTGPAAEFITKHFKTVDRFKDMFAKEAMAIQGSGWVYLARDGKIKTIVNHQIKQDIILLVDWWEHAFALDYQSDKKKYLENQWKIINWDAISATIGLSS